MLSDQWVPHKLNSNTAWKKCHVPTSRRLYSRLDCTKSLSNGILNNCCLTHVNRCGLYFILLVAGISSGKHGWMTPRVQQLVMLSAFYPQSNSTFTPHKPVVCWDVEPIFPYKDLSWILNLFTESFFRVGDHYFVENKGVVFVFISNVRNK